MSEFRLKPGEKITVAVDDAQPAAAPSDDRGPSFIGVDPADEQLYTFRKKVAFGFYDLGTRLRSVPSSTSFDGSRIREYNSTETTTPGDDKTSEYVEIRYEVQGVYAGPTTYPDTDGPFGTVTITAPEHVYLNRALMGSLAPHVDGQPDDPVDPTGLSTVNGSTRKVTNCRRADLSFMVNGAYISEPDDAKEREIKPADANERWNPDNLYLNGVFGYDYNSGPVFSKPFLSDRVQGQGLKVRDFAEDFDQWYYFNFDTDDKVNFKLTTEPTFAGDEVDAFLMTGKERVYLRPTLGKGVAAIDAFQTADLYENSNGPLISAWAMRNFPPSQYPQSPEFQATPYPTFYSDTIGVQDPFAWYYVRSLYSGFVPYFTSTGLVPSARYKPLSGITVQQGSRILNTLPTGSLVAIIARGEERFYVWRKTAWTHLDG